MRALPDSHDPTRPAALPAGRAAVLDLLKREGPLSADDLAARLGITPVAVRQHLAALEDDGLVMPALMEAGAKPRTRGRPLTRWQASAAADAHFPDSHSLLAVDLLGQMKKAFGDDGLERLLALRTKDQAKAYGAAMADETSLKARLEALTRIRAREGYMPELRREGRDWLFVENHCPICAAASLCQGLCREELALFRRLLGPGVTVERTDHILAGARRCAYRVSTAR